MVSQVGLAKFYGSSLPRPQIYEDVKFNAERVDPATPPTVPLLSWAREVTWSMGRLASKTRKRSQGKIEGSLKKLRALEDDDDDNVNTEDPNPEDRNPRDRNPKDPNPEDPNPKDRNPKVPNPSSLDSVSANEGLTVSDDGCSREAVPRTRTRAEKKKKVVYSSCEESDAVSRGTSRTTGNRGRKKHRRNGD